MVPPNQQHLGTKRLVLPRQLARFQRPMTSVQPVQLAVHFQTPSATLASPCLTPPANKFPSQDSGPSEVWPWQLARFQRPMTSVQPVQLAVHFQTPSASLALKFGLRLAVIVHVGFRTRWVLLQFLGQLMKDTQTRGTQAKQITKDQLMALRKQLAEIKSTWKKIRLD